MCSKEIYNERGLPAYTYVTETEIATMVYRDLWVARARAYWSIELERWHRTKPPVNDVIRIDRITDEILHVAQNGFCLGWSPTILPIFALYINVASDRLSFILYTCTYEMIIYFLELYFSQLYIELVWFKKPNENKEIFTLSIYTT